MAIWQKKIEKIRIQLLLQKAGSFITRILLQRNKPTSFTFEKKHSYLYTLPQKRSRFDVFKKEIHLLSVFDKSFAHPSQWFARKKPSTLHTDGVFHFHTHEFPKFRVDYHFTCGEKRSVFSQIKLPSVKFPTLTLPKITLPKFCLSSFKLPQFTTPELTLPKLQLPKFSLPSLSFPIPTLHPLLKKEIHLPKFALPSLSFPWKRESRLIPKLSLPKLVLSSFKFPRFTAPQIKLPTFTIPKIKIQSLQLPTLKLPSFSIPKISFPRLTLHPVFKKEIHLLKLTYAKKIWILIAGIFVSLFSIILLPFRLISSILYIGLQISTDLCIDIKDLFIGFFKQTVKTVQTVLNALNPTKWFRKKKTLKFPQNLPIVGDIKEQILAELKSRKKNSEPIWQKISSWIDTIVSLISHTVISLISAIHGISSTLITSIGEDISSTFLSARAKTLQGIGVLKKILFFRIDFPVLKLPTWKIPKIKFPKLILPKIPQLKLPTFTVPRFPKLAIQEFKLPTVRLPRFVLPRIPLPVIHLPKLPIPSLSFPWKRESSKTWHFSNSWIPNQVWNDIQKLSLPKVVLPKFTFPRLKLPVFTLPKLPSVFTKIYSLPTVRLPKVTLPKLSLPRVSLPMIHLPKLALPSFKFPALKISTFTLQKFTLPHISLPSLSFQKPTLHLPKFVLPKFTFPWFLSLRGSDSDRGNPVFTESTGITKVLRFVFNRFTLEQNGSPRSTRDDIPLTIPDGSYWKRVFEHKEKLSSLEDAVQKKKSASLQHLNNFFSRGRGIFNIYFKKISSPQKGRPSRFFSIKKEYAAPLFLLLLIAGTVGVFFTTFASTTNRTKPITYQGRLMDTNYVPVADTTYQMKFRIYNALTSGTCKWGTGTDTNANNCTTPGALTIAVTRGLFSIDLGDNTTGNKYFPYDFSDATTYLEITIGSETTTPRRRITATPYALNSEELQGWNPTAGVSGGITLIGGTAATDALTLQGTAHTSATAASSSLVFKVGNNGATTAMTILNSGNIGIANTAPSYKLDIASSVASDRGINIAHTGATGTNYGVYSSVTGAATTNIGGYFVATGASTSTGVQIAALTSATSTGIDIGAFSGAGTATGINIGNISNTGANNYSIKLGTLTGGTTANYGISTGILTSATTVTNAQINLGGIVTTGGTTNYGINIGALSGTGTTNYGINIGASSAVGTTNYGMKIGALSGAATTNYGLYIDSITGATSNYGLIVAGGNVGIGTTTPATKLEISQASGAASVEALRLTTTSNNVNSGTYLSFYGNTGSAYEQARIATARNGASSGSYLIFSTYNTSTTTEAMRIDPNGNVGIGTTAPTSHLHLGYSSAKILTAALTELTIDASTNVTATGYSVTGQTIALPAVTNTVAATYAYNGLTLTSGALIQNTNAVTTTWTGVGITMPNITQTTGSLISTGLKITGGTVTSGTSYGLIVDSNAGNVGIGTTAPNSIGANYTSLDIRGSTGGGIETGVSGGNRAHFYSDAGALFMGSFSNIPVYLQMNNTTYMTLNTSGKVGIGTTAPSTLLHLGLAGTTQGTLGLAGATSGLITVTGAAAAGTWTLTLPVDGGSSGQYLQTNGSGTTSWTGGPTVKSITNFETSGRFSTSFTNGTATFGTSGVVLATTGTATSYIKLLWDLNSAASSTQVYAGSPLFSTRLTWKSGSTVTGSAFIGLGSITTSGTDHTFTENHIGFSIIGNGTNTTLYATQANGTTETTSTLTTIDGANVDSLDLILKVNASSSVDYYYRKNAGSLSSATNLTATIPTLTTSERGIQFSASNKGTANLVNFDIGSASYER